MKPTVQSDAEIINEVIDVLMKNLSPSKFVRAMTVLKLGSGDYTKTRDELFAGDTMESLWEELKAFEAEKDAVLKHTK